MFRKILVVLLLLGLLAAGFWWSRAYVRLPFDRVSVFRAVNESGGALIGLPALGASGTTLDEQQLWYLDAVRVSGLLDTLDLANGVEWREWWLLPEAGDGAQGAAYTFIGSARSGLASAWDPAGYGPTLGFADGEIYTDGIATDDPVYFARHHNLLLVGKYPFQIENALSCLTGNLESWADDPGFAKLKPVLDDWPEDGERLILKTAAFEDELPRDWLKTSEIRAYHEIADWWAVHLTATDTGALMTGVLVQDSVEWQPFAAGPAWSLVPEIADRVFPLPRRTSRFGAVTEWLGAGGWQMELAGSRGPERVAPRLWVLPLGDSTRYADFSARYLQAEHHLEEHPYQLFELVQLRTAAGFETLSDRRIWQPWVVALPEALVVSVYREDLERYLDYYMLSASLDKNAGFQQLAGRVTLDNEHAAGFYQWGLVADGETNWLRLLYPGYDWARNGSLYYGVRPAGRGLWSVTGAIAGTPASERRAALRWTTSLPVPDGGLRLLPVRDENEELPRDFLAQAPNGDIWLLDEYGQIRWMNRALPRINAPVWKINPGGGGVSYAATSEARLMIWNEEGELRDPTRVTPSPSAGLTLVNFDRVSAPFLLFPTREGTVEMLDWNGRAAEGWPAKLSGRVVADQPLTHWQLPEEDYLIAWTGEESWQLFGRYGNFITSLTPTPEPPLGAPALEFDPAAPQAGRLLTATATGKVNVWDLEGNVIPLPLGRGPVDNFLFAGIWGDRRGDYVAQRGSLVHLFGYGNDGFKERWQQRFDFAPAALLPAAPLGLIVVQESPDRLWLIDGNGEMLPGGPLAGEGQALLSGDSERGYFVVTVLRGEVYAYNIVFE